MMTGRIAIPARVNVKTKRPVHTGIEAEGSKKFIPKKPVTKVRGIKSVVMMVRVFMMSFMRLLTDER
jgi:hypothetical protein